MGEVLWLSLRFSFATSKPGKSRKPNSPARPMSARSRVRRYKRSENMRLWSRRRLLSLAIRAAREKNRYCLLLVIQTTAMPVAFALSSKCGRSDLALLDTSSPALDAVQFQSLGK